jgi:cytochrome c biogenesis protein CcmG, thiol:disulfide interchange protein DsbE
MQKKSLFTWCAILVIIFISGKGLSGFLNQKLIESGQNNVMGKTKVELNSIVQENPTKPAKNEKGMPLVPNFTLLDENMKQVSISDYSGKIIVLNFWASWCPPCKEEFPDFKEMNDEFLQGTDVVLLTINLTDGVRETRDKAMEFLLDNGYEKIKTLFDEEGLIANLFGISSVPTTVVIDRDGYIYYYTLGATSKDILLPIIEGVN